MSKTVFVFFTCIALVSLSNSTIHAAFIRTMILDGQSTGTYHNWQHTTPILKKELEEPALSCVAFITTFQRGAEWAATGNVTQKLPATFPTAETVRHRVDTAAMDPAFKKGPAPH